MTKYRIMFLVNGLSPYRLQFFRELAKYCHLTVVCERKVATDRKWKIDTVNNINFELIVMKGFSKTSDTAFCPSVLLYLNRAYDLIIVANYSTPTGILAILFLKITNKKFAIECDGGIIKNGTNLKEKIKKILISSAKWWFSPSDESDEYLIYYGAKKKMIYRYPFSSVPSQDILKAVLTGSEKGKIKEELDINYHSVIISIGQFIHRKGFDVLIKASKLIDEDVGVLIIGGKATDAYASLVKGLNLRNIHFYEFMHKEALELYYKSADLFVLPTREDIWGLVINEAMAYGLPVITTDHCVAGLELVKNNENGFIVTVDDPLELADRMNRIINDDKLRMEMSKSSLSKIKKYTVESMALHHMDLFNKIIQ